MEARIRQLVSALPVSKKLSSDVDDYLNYNELGLAFELLCNGLSEEKVIITREQYRELAAIGSGMKMDLAAWLKDIHFEKEDQDGNGHGF